MSYPSWRWRKKDGVREEGWQDTMGTLWWLPCQSLRAFCLRYLYPVMHLGSGIPWNDWHPYRHPMEAWCQDILKLHLESLASVGTVWVTTHPWGFPFFKRRWQQLCEICCIFIWCPMWHHLYVHAVVENTRLLKSLWLPWCTSAGDVTLLSLSLPLSALAAQVTFIVLSRYYAKREALLLNVMPCSFKKQNLYFMEGGKGPSLPRKIDRTGECMHACLELLLRRQRGDGNY